MGEWDGQRLREEVRHRWRGEGKWVSFRQILQLIFERGGKELQALTIIEFVFILCALALSLFVYVYYSHCFVCQTSVSLFSLPFSISSLCCALCNLRDFCFCFRFLVFLFSVFSFLVINCRVTRAGCASREKHKNNKTKDNLWARDSNRTYSKQIHTYSVFIL